MADTLRYVYGWGYEDSAIVLMARLYGLANVPIIQANVTSIAYTVYQCTNQDEAEADVPIGTLVSGGGGSLVVASTVFDTLQTDAPWTADSTGYNFRFTSPAADRPTGGKWYRYVIRFTMSDGTLLPFVALVHTPALNAS